MARTNLLMIIVVAVLVAMLITGIATRNCGEEAAPIGGVPNGEEPNGEVTNGEEPNGEEPNGEEPNGEEPNGVEPGEPDLTSGMGAIIDCDANNGDDPEAGDPAFDFRFQDAAGTTFSLSDFRGKIVVLNFWATWCGFCKQDRPLIQQFYDEKTGTELVLFTINKGEDSPVVTAFLQDEGFSFPVLLDSAQKVVTEYRVTGIPRTFFIDEEGIIQVIKRGYFHAFEDIEAILDQLLGQEGG